jgi:hypothetical protein
MARKDKGVGPNRHLASGSRPGHHHLVWRRQPPSELLEIRRDLTGIIEKLMAMDAKLDRILEGTEEDEDGGEEDNES